MTAPHSPLLDALRNAAVPITAEDIDAAQVPWPHIWIDGHAHGLLPRGEVTVLASLAREGKSFCVTTLAAALASVRQVGGMKPLRGRGTTVILSAEDTRVQYARKLLALTDGGTSPDAARVLDHVIVPNLDADALESLRTLVRDDGYGRPVPSEHVVETITGALRELSPSLIIAETASTLSECDEGNRAFRCLVRVLRTIARRLDCAALLTHHFSQSAMADLPTLDLSTAAFRGGTALTGNSRQNAALVNLGSDSNPFPDTDARTILRRLVKTPPNASGVSAWITLDTSKLASPPPIFFAWHSTSYGPALLEANPVDEIKGASWRHVQKIIRSQMTRKKKDESGLRQNRGALTANTTGWMDVGDIRL